MSRRPPPNSLDRSTLKNLNDRENIRKIVKSKEFNLERQKELRKIIEGQTQLLINQQKIKAKKLKASRGKNLRGELVANKNKQRRFERGERRYKETEEPRIVGDPQVQPTQFTGFTNQSPEDRQLVREKLRLEYQDRQQSRQLETDKLVEDRRYRDDKLLQQQGIADRLAQLEQLRIKNDRDIRADQNEISRMELQAKRDNIDIEPIPEEPFNIGNHQFFNNLLSGVAQDKQREREHTQTIMRELLNHNARTQGAMNPDILEGLYQRARDTGLRPPGSVISLGPNPPPPSVIELPDRPPPSSAQEIASRVREVLSGPPVGSQISIGALTELEQELERPILPNQGQDAVQRYLQTAESDIPVPDPDEVSSITSTEWDRRVNRAEDEFYATSEGQRLEESNILPDFAFVSPFEDLDLTASETSRLGKQSDLTTAQELEQLRQQEIATARLEAIRESQDIPEEIEEGAGVGELVGGAISNVGGAVLDVAGGVVQGVGGAVRDRLPTPGQVGRAVGRGIVSAGGAVLGAGVDAGGAILSAGAGAIQGALGGGAIEEVVEDLPAAGGVTDEGELLEEVPISNLNPAEIDSDDIDVGDFVIYHGEQSSRLGRPPILERERGPKYSISNTSDRNHKKLTPGQKVDITSYGADKKGNTIGYFGYGGGVSGGGGQRRETKLQLDSLDKSLNKGFLKLHKNY